MNISLSAQEEATSIYNDSIIAMSFHQAGVEAYRNDFYSSAIHEYSQALKIRQDIFDRPHNQIARSHLNIGIAYKYTEQYILAIRYLNEALHQYQILQENELVAQCFFELGWVHRNLGDYKTAQLYQENAVQLYTSLYGKTDFDVAFSIEQLAITYDEMGQHEQAILQFEKSLQTFKALNDDYGVATSLQNMGNAYDRLGQFEPALEKHIEAKKYFSLFGEEGYNEITNVLNDLSLVYFHLGELDSAEIIGAKSFERRKKSLPAGHPDLAMSLDNLGNFSDARGNYSQAQNMYEEALTFIQDSSQGNYRLTILHDYLSSLIKQQQGSADQNLEDKITREIDVIHQQIDLLRNQFSNQGSKLIWIRKARSIHQLILTYYNQNYQQDGKQKWVQKALIEMEKSKSLLLLETIQKRIIGQEELIGVQQNVSTNIQERIAYWTLEKDKGQRHAVDSLIYWNTQLTLASKNVDIGKMNEADESIPKHDLHQALSDALTSSQACMSILVGGNEVFIHYFSDDYKTLYTVPFGSDQKNEIDTLLTWTSTAPGDFKILSGQNIKTYQSRWYNLFFPSQVQQDLSSKSHLTIIPDGPFINFPFEILINEKEQLLIQDISTNYHYSTRILLESLRNKSVNFATASVAMLSPDFKNHSILPQLIGAQEEWLMIQGLFKQSIKSAETPLNLSTDSDIFHSDILHIATHAVGDSISEFRSHLIWPNGNHDITKIYNWQLTGLPWRNELVVLASCETGLGRLHVGEGVFNLARSFFDGGIPEALISQWKTNDRSSSRILGQWYKELSDGTDLAQSLRKSKLAYINDPLDESAHPYYWANMQYWGSEKLEHRKYAPALFILFGLLITMLLFGIYKISR